MYNKVCGADIEVVFLYILPYSQSCLSMANVGYSGNTFLLVLHFLSPTRRQVEE